MPDIDLIAKDIYVHLLGSFADRALAHESLLQKTAADAYHAAEIFVAHRNSRSRPEKKTGGK